MPTLLAETIMQTVVTVIDTAMTANIYRGRVDQIPDAKLPAVGVFQGAEEPAGENGPINTGVLDQLLEVRTEVAASGYTEAEVEAALNDLRREVHLALLADHTIGLAYVIDVMPAGVDEPSLEGGTEKITGSMVVQWVIQYRHQYADAGAAP